MTLPSSLASTTWLVTGAAGFIGSHLCESLLQRGATVRALDNLATGKSANIELLQSLGGNFAFTHGSIEDRPLLAELCTGVDYVLHQAALGSVPRSMENPLASHDANVNGFISMLDAARRAGVKRMVYASSSSVYGDSPLLPKVEDIVGNTLSPYAATKWINEVYAGVFARAYGFGAIGLRYFNVFGPRQDPEGAYAAVIPRWFRALYRGEPVTIFGDGETSRDFCYIANVVQANLRAALAPAQPDLPLVYNVAVGGRTTLAELYTMIRAQVAVSQPAAAQAEAIFAGFRPGDIRHSNADISRARQWLGYAPTHNLAEGLNEAAAYYQRFAAATL